MADSSDRRRGDLPALNRELSSIESALPLCALAVFRELAGTHNGNL